MAEGIDHRRGAAGGQVVSLQVVGEQRLGEVEVAVERLAVRVEQQLARIAAVTRRGIPWPVYPEAVTLTGCDGGQVAVPHVAVDLVEVDALLAAVLGDQAQLHPLGDLGEQREVRARAVVCGAERIVVPGHTVGTDAGSADGHQPTHQPVAAPIWRPSSAAMVRMYVVEMWWASRYSNTFPSTARQMSLRHTASLMSSGFNSGNCATKSNVWL